MLFRSEKEAELTPWVITGFDDNTNQAQTFTVNASIILPDGVTNLSKHSLDLVIVGSVEESKIASINISNQTIEISKGDTYQLEPQILPLTTLDQRLNYTSSDASIVTVSNAGLITAKDMGIANVTITSQANPEITITVAIQVIVAPPSNLQIRNKTVSSIELTWVSAQTAASYTVYRSTSDEIGRAHV